MKKLILLAAILLMSFSVSALAFESSDIENYQEYNEVKAYSTDFDLLVLDVVILDNSGEPDVLQAVTVNNTRDANNDDIEKVILWADNGDDLWQGYMIDNTLGEGVRVDFRRWVFSDLNYDIPVGGLHLYVSVETKTTVNTNRKMQFEIDALSDGDNDGVYNSGDKGIFVESTNNGPSDASIVSGQVYTLENRTNDFLAPKVNIENIIDGGVYELGDSFIVEGYSKDRMQGSTKFLQVSVVPHNTLAEWHDAVAVETNYAFWRYEIPTLSAGEHDVQTYVSDWGYNTAISDIITITLTDPIVELDEEVVPEPEPEIIPPDANEWSGILVKTEATPRVYLLKDDVRYWFYNEAIFYQYYDDFSTVQLISSDEMAQYAEGKDMQMKQGSLIKRIIGPKVYEIGTDWQIRWIHDEDEAISLYGEDWAEKINLVPDQYFNQYNEVESL
ncbi:MAG: hypothetical protein AUJ28_01560 [Parcubacteria group bacterium CG1_02_37_51]|nr:MAG: hypothetical protein AUJ28_01560 [Parcubacteria group bacterium CG1_02_37_51]